MFVLFGMFAPVVGAPKSLEYVARAFDDVSWNALLDGDEVVMCGDRGALVRLWQGSEDSLDPALQLQDSDRLYLLDYCATAADLHQLLCYGLRGRFARCMLAPVLVAGVCLHACVYDDSLQYRSCVKRMSLICHRGRGGCTL